MPKKKKATTRAKVKTPPKARPKNQPSLPGMEDHGIQPLDDVGEEYTEIRDQRMDLTEREHALKIHAMRLMKKYGKTIYRHNGVEITVVPGEDDLKVKLKKAGDEDDDSDTPKKRRFVEHVGEAETI